MKAVFVIQTLVQVHSHFQQVTEMVRKQTPTAMQIMAPP